MPDTVRFRILAHPKMVKRATAGRGLDYVEFFASHGPRTCESGAWQRTISLSCSILSNRQNWLQISSVNCMKGPPWLFPETTVPPNSFCLGIASPLGNHRGPRAFLVTGMRNTSRKSGSIRLSHALSKIIGTSWKLNPLGLNAVDLSGSLSLRRRAASINVARADLTPCSRGPYH